MNARRSGRSTPRLSLTLLLAAVAALGAVLVLARQVPYGAGLHWDSVIYVTAARNLLAGAGLRDYTGFTYVWWPPLYPLVLAVASLDVLDPLDVAGSVNVALFGLTIFVVGQYLRRRLESPFLVVWAVLTIALATPLAGLASYAFAGTSFILLVTLTLTRTDAFLAEGRTSALVWAGVWAALAWQTRYVGGALPAAVAVMLLLQRGVRPAQRVRRAAGFSLLAGAPMALWLMRNRLLTGTFTGSREGGILSLPATLSGSAEVLWSWAGFDLPLVEWRAVALPGLLLAAALAAACGMLIRGRRRTRPMPSGWLPCYVFGGFALTYFTALVASLALGTTRHLVQPRYLAPLYVPLLVTAVFALDRVLGFAPRRRRFRRLWKRRWAISRAQAAAAVITAVLCIWTAGQIEPNAREIRQANSEGLTGYSHSNLSGTRAWISQNPLTGLILSNSHVSVGIDNDVGARYVNLPDREERLEERLQQLRAEGHTYYVVWFDKVWVNTFYDFSRAALRASPALEQVAELADGAVFKSAPTD